MVEICAHKFNEKQVKYTQQCTCIIRNLNVNKFNHCRVNSCCLQFPAYLQFIYFL